MSDIGRARYRLHKLKKNINNSTKKLTPKILKTERVQAAKRRILGDPKKLRQLRAKIINGTATAEDKLNYRTYQSADKEMKFQGASSLASKVAIMSAPVTGGAGAIASAAISGASTAKGIYNVATRGSEGSNRKLASKAEHELTNRDRSRLAKADKIADKLKSPAFQEKLKEEARKKKLGYLKLAKYAREEKADRAAREKRLKRESEKSKNGFTNEQFDVIKQALTKKSERNKPKANTGSTAASKASEFLKNKL